MSGAKKRVSDDLNPLSYRMDGVVVEDDAVPPNSYARCAFWTYAAYAALCGGFAVAFIVMVAVVECSSVKLLTLTATAFSAFVNGAIAVMIGSAYPSAEAPWGPVRSVWPLGPVSEYAQHFRYGYDRNQNHLRWVDYGVTGAAFGVVRYSLVKRTEPVVVFAVVLCYFMVYFFYYLRELVDRRAWVAAATAAWLAQFIPLLVIFPSGDATAIVLVIAALVVFLTNALLNWMAPYRWKDVTYLFLNGVYRVVIAWVSFFSVVDQSV